jgi:ATP-independent RNA helicase DbpA
VVGTPGRVQELLRKKALELRDIRVLVLDEADRLLRHGIRGTDPRDRQGDAQAAPDVAVLRDVPRRRARTSHAPRCARPWKSRWKAPPDAAAIDQRFYEVDPRRSRRPSQDC